jgi:2,4-dienoyl-CoA reductase-like NADH-dependent reductase (Old Yellow Enzyme family)
MFQAAMAESMAPASDNHTPNQKFSSAYGKWADGGWGMILTGTKATFYTYMSQTATGLMNALQEMYKFPKPI